MSSQVWAWDPARGDHYRVLLNPDGTYTYIYAKDRPSSAAAAPVSSSDYRAPQPGTPSNAGNTQYQQNNPGGAAPAPSSAPHTPQHPNTARAVTSAPYRVNYAAPAGISSSAASIPQHPPGGQQLHARSTEHQQDHGRPREDSLMSSTMPGNIVGDLPPHVSPEPIIGNLRTGEIEPLDSSYFVRRYNAAEQFFKKGRVFAVLFAEAASAAAAQAAFPDGTVLQYPNPRSNPGYTQGRFGEYVFSNIRRFVIVKVPMEKVPKGSSAKPRPKHFAYACPILTYSGRGTTKPDCDPAEHTIVHFRGTKPCYLQGENGMTMDPIEIEHTSDPRATLKPASRLHLGMTYPVQWNVKVKDIGMVSQAHLKKLKKYWKTVNEDDSDED